jgi:hypothetical protein
MRANLAAISVSIFSMAVFSALPQVASAQENTPAQSSSAAETPAIIGQAGYSSVYCSGFVKDNRLSEEIRVISGEHAYYKLVFTTPEYVYISEGSDKGVKVGDRFMVVRSDEDPAKSEWFSGQTKLVREMGTLYRDIGQLRVINVQRKVSIAEVIFSCDYMQRGDIVRPYEERTAPPLKDGTFDHFAPPSGKKAGLLVAAADYAQSPGKGSTVYVNLGAAEGIKIGDYVRIFRYQGKPGEYVPNLKNYQYETYGFGGTRPYSWKDLPREVLGEGVVINASRRAATVMITASSAEIYSGDSVEIE